MKTMTDDEARAVAEGLGHAQRDADRIGEEEARDAEGEGDGEARDDEFAGRAVGVVVGGHAEAHGVVEEPAAVLDEKGPVEAELADEFAALLLGDGRDLAGGGAALAAAEAAEARQAHFDGAAGEDARQGEADERDAEEGRDGQEEAADDVGEA